MNKSKTTAIRLFFVTFLLCGLMTIPTQAAPGDLDPTFGDGGIRREDWGDYFGEYVIKVEPHPNGAISTLGYLVNGDYCDIDNRGILYGSCDFEVLRDGKIVVPTIAEISPHIWRFAVKRFTADWLPDPAFGTNGIVFPDLGSNYFLHAWGLEIHASGKMTFTAIDGRIEPAIPYLIRLNADGSTDSGFGNNGTKRIEGGFPSHLRVQSDGKVLLQILEQSSSYLVRLNADGSTDNGFGMIDFGNASIGDIELQADGRFLVSIAENGLAHVKRFNPTGSLDATFGVDGQVSGLYPAIAIQKDGKILLGGAVTFRVAVSRLNRNGALDLLFGVDGYAITDIGGSHVVDLKLQNDGKIVAGVAAGWSDIVVARFLNDVSGVRFDYDGDGRSDISVFRPSNQTWYINGSQAGLFGASFGLPSDKLTPADYDGDGKTDISVFRDGTWYWLNSSNGNFNAIQFGLAGDIPVPADYTGDGRAELAVYRDGVWWTFNLANNQSSVIQFGLSTDKPIAADYDGDGKADQAVYRNGEWHLNRSTQGYAVVQFGLAADKPLPADYDGDGKADVAVYRDGTWYVLQTSQGFTAFQWGISTDIPAPADYDGDGKADAAVFRDGTWYSLQSTSGISIQQFGLVNDKPIPAAYIQ